MSNEGIWCGDGQEENSHKANSEKGSQIAARQPSLRRKKARPDRQACGEEGREKDWQSGE
ncbi:MAG: hypothetical protein WA303_21340 [Bradyrhizobium sp.]